MVAALLKSLRITGHMLTLAIAQYEIMKKRDFGSVKLGTRLHAKPDTWQEIKLRAGLISVAKVTIA